VLWVRAPVESFLPLFEAARAEGLRAGWLELEPPPRHEAFERATTAGALRAVAVGGGHAASLKRVAGLPVLADLLREHFLGCVLVLVRGEPGEASSKLRPLPPPRDAGEPAWRRLVPAAPGAPWTLESADGTEHRLELTALVKRLRRPRLD
jgi:hypothetical protein